MPQLAVKLKQLLAIWLLNWKRITSQDFVFESKLLLSPCG
jgi:hypothetical protein